MPTDCYGLEPIREYWKKRYQMKNEVKKKTRIEEDIHGGETNIQTKKWYQRDRLRKRRREESEEVIKCCNCEGINHIAKYCSVNPNRLTRSFGAIV